MTNQNVMVLTVKLTVWERIKVLVGASLYVPILVQWKKRSAKTGTIFVRHRKPKELRDA